MMNYIYNLQGFISKEAFGGVVLFFATLLAVIIANSSLAPLYFELWNMPLGITLGELKMSMTLTYWIDDGLMAIFFLMIGLEIKRELLLGELSSVQKASFPIVAALGGMIVPALFYVAFNPSNPLGFGIPMATDIAFALGILMLLGKRVNPALKLFLVALAVVDDLGAVMVVATVYTNELHLEYLIHVAVIYGFIWFLNFKGFKALGPYLILGIALWIYIHAVGVHATIAGVLLAFAIPIQSRIDEDRFIDESQKALMKFQQHRDPIPMLNMKQIHALEEIAYGYYRVQNPLIKLEHNLHNLSAFFIMPLFAFSNAGVVIELSSVSQHLMIVLGVIFGLVIGKPLGIFSFTYLANKLYLVKKPINLSWEEILAVGFLGGIGFTMSIFITHLAFMDQSIIDAVKLGVFVASFISAVIGVAMIMRISKKKR